MIRDKLLPSQKKFRPAWRLSQAAYRPDIDGLRAISVLAVMVFHAFPEWNRGGFTGVDVFFVISGFLISTMIFKSLDRGTFRFSEFYARRIRRIIPSLLPVLSACAAFGWFALLAYEYKQLGKHIAAGTVFISNFVLWDEAGYFDNSAWTKPLLHLWSLGIEEQFYIVWPPLLWLTRKRKFAQLFLILGIALVSFSLNVRGIGEDADAVFYSPLTRFWELMCGSLLAWTGVYGKRGNPAFRRAGGVCLTGEACGMSQRPGGKIRAGALSLAGFALLVYGFWHISAESGFPGAQAAIPVLGTALIISAGAEAWLNRTVLSNRILVWTGLISFPLYLWHWPLLSFARIMEEGTPVLPVRIACLLLAVVLACATYRFIERPVRSGPPDARKVLLLCFLSMLIGIWGYSIYKNDGFGWRIRDKAGLAKVISTPFPEVPSFSCKGHLGDLKLSVFNDDGCSLSKDSKPSIMFLGDSHMNHYRNALWDYFSEYSVALLIGKRGCLPFSSRFIRNRPGCLAKYNEVVRFLEADRDIKVLYLSAYWSKSMSSDIKKGAKWRVAAPFNAGDRDSFEAAAERFLRAALSGGRQVVFMKDVPDLTFDLRSCFDVRPLRLTEKRDLRHDCSLSYDEYKGRMALFDGVIKDILAGFPNVKVFDPVPVLCASGKCMAKENGLPLYSNADHLNYLGAGKVIAKLKKRTPPEGALKSDGP